MSQCFTKWVITLLLLSVMPGAVAQAGEGSAVDCDNANSSLPTVSLTELLDVVSARTGKSFLMDVRVRPDVVIGGLEAADMSYPVLLSVLKNNDLAAVTVAGIVNIVPVRSIRQYPLPMVNSDDDSIADDEWVMRIIHTKNTEAVYFVPILRPMIPQAGFLAGTPSSNSLMIIDRYGNVRRLTEIVREIDEQAAVAYD